MSKKTIQSIGAVIAGFLTVVVLSTLTDTILEKTGIFPSAQMQMQYGPERWLLVVALLYRTVFTVLGGFVTAKLAPAKPMRHVKILAILGTIGGLLGVVAGWNLSEHWYPIALALFAFPSVWLGGKLQTKK